MLRSSLCIAGALVLAGSATAQSDASNRLQPVATQVKQVTYEMATGNLRSSKGPSAFFGPEIIYNNTCHTGFYAGFSPGDAFLDNGQLPGSGNLEAPGILVGCADSLIINGFYFAYCTSLPSTDLRVGFYELLDNCSDVATALGTTAVFDLIGLPGGGTGGFGCWGIVIDLMGTSFEFKFQSDGDGTWDYNGALDTFGVSYEPINLTSSTAAVGMILSGGPVYLGSGCDFGVGTVYNSTDPTGSAPAGTGYGSTDSFGLMQSGVYAGCFFFGGWPANPWSSYELQLFTMDAGCNPCASTVICDGVGNPVACPCGNTGGGTDRGCANTGTDGATLCVMDDTVANFTILADNVAPGNGGIFLSGTAAGGVAVFDGVTCTAGSTLRLGAGFETAPGARLSAGGSITTEGNAASPGYFVAGSTDRKSVV